MLMATYFAFITVQGWIETKWMWTLNSYIWCRLTSLVVTSSFSDTFTISRSFSSSKDLTRSMYTANLSFRCCKSCFSCRRVIRVGERGVEAAGRTVSRLGVAVAITLFVILLRRLVSKLEEMGIAFLLESCSVYLIAESLSVNKSWAHGQQCLPKLRVVNPRWPLPPTSPRQKNTTLPLSRGPTGNHCSRVGPIRRFAAIFHPVSGISLLTSLYWYVSNIQNCHSKIP